MADVTNSIRKTAYSTSSVHDFRSYLFQYEKNKHERDLVVLALDQARDRKPVMGSQSTETMRIQVVSV